MFQIAFVIFKLDIKGYFTRIKVKKNLKTYKMYKKTLIYLISRIRYLILAMKSQKSTYKTSLCALPIQLISNLPLHFQKRLYRFSIEERLLREITM